uniref:Uncharacterized protein n=1 Tax=Physcomitrium patens TaxID=3218 RepID=A0A2K1JVY5_PHYPA|nr:hypothetical protein PHYPA_015459 [Physcomitrium patens]
MKALQKEVGATTPQTTKKEPARQPASLEEGNNTGRERERGGPMKDTLTLLPPQEASRRKKKSTQLDG